MRYVLTMIVLLCLASTAFGYTAQNIKHEVPDCLAHDYMCFLRFVNENCCGPFPPDLLDSVPALKPYMALDGDGMIYLKFGDDDDWGERFTGDGERSVVENGDDDDDAPDMHWWTWTILVHVVNGTLDDLFTGEGDRLHPAWSFSQHLDWIVWLEVSDADREDDASLDGNEAALDDDTSTIGTSISTVKTVY